MQIHLKKKSARIDFFIFESISEYLFFFNFHPIDIFIFFVIINSKELKSIQANSNIRNRHYDKKTGNQNYCIKQNPYQRTCKRGVSFRNGKTEHGLSASCPAFSFFIRLLDCSIAQKFFYILFQSSLFDVLTSQGENKDFHADRVPHEEKL